MQRRYWSSEQDQILKSIVDSTDNLNWVSISDMMNQKLCGITRNPKQCRERWINKIKCCQYEEASWSSEEEENLIREFLLICKTEKNKWVHLANRLNSVNSDDFDKRCQRKKMPNEIKNKFYSIFRKGVRKINSELGKPLKSEEIRLMKPVSISKIFESLEQQKSEEFLYFIYSKACPMLGNRIYSKQSIKEMINIIMRLNEKMPQQLVSQSLIKFEKKRKSSLSTNEELKIDKFHEQTLSQENEIKVYDSQKEYIDMFFGSYMEISESLQFEDIDLGF